VLVETLSDCSNRYPEVGVSVADGYTTTMIDWVTGGRWMRRSSTSRAARSR
jgi:LysR family transcriptional regulator, nitrogen assimilation regulatory protein